MSTAMPDLPQGQTQDAPARPEPLFGVGELPPQILETYAHLWQFETWLRRLVYVQLRALDGDAWETKINAAAAAKPKGMSKEDYLLNVKQQLRGNMMDNKNSWGEKVSKGGKGVEVERAMKK